MPSRITNIRIYLEIAEEAAQTAKRLSEEGRVPKPHGEPGWVVRRDPDRRSFKQSLIAIAFAGAYLEALLGLKGRDRYDARAWKKFDRETYERKLEMLGVTEPKLLEDAKRFREARKDVMHEKAVDMDAGEAFEHRIAQVEAEHGIEFVREVTKRFADGAGERHSEST